MAIDIVAKLRLLDEASRPLRKAMGSFGALGAKAASATAAVGGIAAAFLSAKAAVSLFDKTIGAAANYEMREVTVKAMFSDEYSKTRRNTSISLRSALPFRSFRWTSF